MKEIAMTVWVRKAANIFSIFQVPRIPLHGEAQKKRHRKDVVRQTSNGNVLLQLGNYVTEEEIDRLKKDLAI